MWHEACLSSEAQIIADSPHEVHDGLRGEDEIDHGHATRDRGNDRPLYSPCPSQAECPTGLPLAPVRR